MKTYIPKVGRFSDFDALIAALEAHGSTKPKGRKPASEQTRRKRRLESWRKSSETYRRKLEDEGRGAHWRQNRMPQNWTGKELPGKVAEMRRRNQAAAAAGNPPRSIRMLRAMDPGLYYLSAELVASIGETWQQGERLVRRLHAQGFLSRVVDAKRFETGRARGKRYTWIYAITDEGLKIARGCPVAGESKGPAR